MTSIVESTIQPHRLDRRIFLIGSLAVLSLASTLLIRADASAQVFFLLISRSIFWIAWLAACIGWGSLIPIPKSVPTVLKIVTQFGIGFGLISFVVLMIGSLGGMDRWTAFGLVGIGIGISVIQVVRSQVELKSWMNGRAGFGWIALLAAPFLGATTLGACVLPGVLWGDEPHGYDVLSYHLLLPREWFELGKIVGFQHNVFSFFPLNVEMHYLLAMHLTGSPFGGMYLAQFMHATITLASAVVVYGALRERSRLSAVVGAVACAAIPWVGMLGAVAYNDGGAMFFGALACVWSWRATYERNEAEWRDRMMMWVIAGASAGLAMGCKYPALITVVLLPVILLIRKPFKPSIAGVVIYVLCALFVASPWLIRNYSSTGNPVFPLASGIFGKSHWDDGQIERFNIAHSPTANEKSIGGRLVKFENEVIVERKNGRRHINARYGLLCMVFLVGLIGTTVRHDPASIRLCGYLISVSVVWLAFTHLQGRFFAPMIPIVCWLACLHANRVSLCIVGASILVGTFASPTIFLRLQQTHVVTFGFEDIQGLTSERWPIGESVIEGNREIVFVGDAAVFWCSVPMDRIGYRTVFDVPSEARDLVEAYSKDAPAGSILIVDESELARLSKTYRNLPEIPEGFRGDSVRVVVKP